MRVRLVMVSPAPPQWLPARSLSAFRRRRDAGRSSARADRPATREPDATLLAMASTARTSIEIETDLLERAQRAARERGVEVPELVREALEHELAGAGSESLSRAKDEGEQPPLTCIGAFSSGRGDLSRLAAEDVFEPRPSR